AELGPPADWVADALAWLRELPRQAFGQPCWTQAELRTLDQLLAGFKGSVLEGPLAAHVARQKAPPIAAWVSLSLAGWVVFWAAFLFAFPWSRNVQAAFFWNPKARALLSLWFVPLLLLTVPPLRRRLLAPFRDALAASARLDALEELAFFGKG